MLRFNRRRFLQASAALGSMLASGARQVAQAAPEHVDAPVVDRVVIREITDNQHNIFLKPLERPGLRVARTGFPAAPQGKTLESEWGLALHIESTKGNETRRYLLDYGFMCGRPLWCKEKMEDQQFGQVQSCVRPRKVRYA